MKMMKYDAMLRSTLMFVLVAVMLLSTVLGMHAQAAENKLRLELPTEYFGEATDSMVVKENNSTLYAFLVSGDPIEQIINYVTELEREFGIEPQVKMEDNMFICYMKEDGELHIMIMLDCTGKKVLVGYNNETTTIIDGNADEETQKETPVVAVEHEIKNISSTYITDGGDYTVAVGDAITLYNPRTPTSPYYAYTWSVTEGEDHVMLDRDQGTCQVVGLTEGEVTLECGLDYTVNYYPGKYDSYHYTYTITIHVVGPEHSGENDYGTMTGKLCPRCHGNKKVELGGEKVSCDVCNETGLWP